MAQRRPVVTPGILTIGVVGLALTAFEAASLAATDASDVGWQWGWLGLGFGLAILGLGALRLVMNLRRARKS